MIRFSIPGDPHGWQRTRTRNGQHFTAPETRAYQNTVRWMAKAAGANPYEGPVSVEITAFFEIPKSATKARRAEIKREADFPTKKPDIDNIVKVILDSLNGMAWGDDAQVVSLSVLKRWSEAGPRVDVAVFPYAHAGRLAA